VLKWRLETESICRQLLVEELGNIATQRFELVLDADGLWSLSLIARGKVGFGVRTVTDRCIIARDDDGVVASTFDLIVEFVRAIAHVGAFGFDHLTSRPSDHRLQIHARQIE
jgi:hypothetical protein